MAYPKMKYKKLGFSDLKLGFSDLKLGFSDSPALS
jgi:hypothetical protein